VHSHYSVTLQHSATAMPAIADISVSVTGSPRERHGLAVGRDAVGRDAHASARARVATLFHASRPPPRGVAFLPGQLLAAGNSWDRNTFLRVRAARGRCVSSWHHRTDNLHTKQ